MKYTLALQLFILITTTKFDYHNILRNSPKADVEFIFDSDYNLDEEPGSNYSIRKYFHNIYETELNIHNGARMKCYTPAKINRDNQRHLSVSNEETEIPEDYARILMRESAKICTNGHFDSWFYKLCPFKSAAQVLSYKKKDEQGNEYTESFSLGERESVTYIEDIYSLAKNDTVSLDIPPSHFLNTFDRIAKIYNEDLNNYKKYEVNLVINYSLEELKTLSDVIVNRYARSLDQYLKDNPNAKTIPIERKIIKVISKHIVLLESPFPLPRTQSSYEISIIKQKTRNDIEHSFNLMIYGDYVYCFRCEFLVYYNTGDSLFVKNGKYSDAMKFSFTSTAYKSRRIMKIIDNQLLQVESKFPRDYQGVVLRGNYFTLDSDSRKVRWEYGYGIVRSVSNLIVGTNTRFMSQFTKGDKLVYYKPTKTIENYHSTSTNVKFHPPIECEVDRVISNNFMFTKEPCERPLTYKGEYLIPKPFTKPTYFSLTPIEERQMFSLIDFHTIEGLGIAKAYKQFYHSDWLFHPGFLLTSSESVVRMDLSKIIPQISYMRIVLGVNLDNYEKKQVDEDSDYEIIINSQSGVLIKKIKGDSDMIEFYDTGINTLYTEKISIDIVFTEKEIYFITLDDDTKSAKVKYNLPEGVSIKYFLFNLKNSDNVTITNMKKTNYIERRQREAMFIHNTRLSLSRNAYFKEEFINGDHCEATNSPRKSVIEYRCDTSGVYDLLIENVKETRVCEYYYYVKTKFLCNPEVIMRNKIKSSVTKSKCVVDNDLYVKSSGEFFYSD